MMINSFSPQSVYCSLNAKVKVSKLNNQASTINGFNAVLITANSIISLKIITCAYWQLSQGQLVSKSITVTITMLFFLGATTILTILSSLVLPSNA